MISFIKRLRPESKHSMVVTCFGEWVVMGDEPLVDKLKGDFGDSKSIRWEMGLIEDIED